MVASGPGAVEAVLQHVGPGPARLVVAAERGEGHPQVAGRQAVELLAESAEDPPSSATVTIAVSWSVTRRRADSDADSPCPPPKATTDGSAAGADGAERARARLIPGPGPGAARWSRRRCAQPAGELLGDGGAAVLAAGAADGDGREPLAFADVADRHATAAAPARQERLGARLAEHVLADRPTQPGLRSQLGNPVRVGQEPDVQNHVGVDREAVLEAEGEQSDPQLSSDWRCRRRCGPGNRSWWTFRDDVSMTRSAAARRVASSSRSRTIPSSSRPSPCSGCGRRTDSCRRTMHVVGGL